MQSHDTEDLADIRRAVTSLCEGFPGEYWRAKDAVREYPGEFVDALTKAGFLAALIPVEHGGSGLSLAAACVIMEEIQASGCNGSSAHAQMYIMNTLLRYGSEAQKAEYLPRIASGELRLAGVRRVRTDQRHRYPQPENPCSEGRRRIHHHRPENLDEPGRTFRSDAAARPHHPARRSGEQNRRAYRSSSSICRRRWQAA